MNLIFVEPRHIAGNFIRIFLFFNIYFRNCYLIIVQNRYIIEEIIKYIVSEKSVKR